MKKISLKYLSIVPLRLILSAVKLPDNRRNDPIESLVDFAALNKPTVNTGLNACSTQIY